MSCLKAKKIQVPVINISMFEVWIQELQRLSPTKASPVHRLRNQWSKKEKTKNNNNKKPDIYSKYQQVVVN